MSDKQDEGRQCNVGVYFICREIIVRIWFALAWLLVLSWIFTGDLTNRTVAVSSFVCGITLLILWKKWPFTNKGRVGRKKFILAGSLGAVYVETVFWFFEKVSGATGIAASPDLMVDLLVTMPWYIAMVALLWKVVNKYKYTYTKLFLLAGVYELGADGVVAGILGGKTSPELFLVSFPIMFPLFTILYGLMVLPPVRMLYQSVNPPGASLRKRYFYALLPFLGLIPYIPLIFLTRAG